MANTMYSKSGCYWCDKLRDELVKRHVAFTEVKVDASLENLAELKQKYPEARTVPQFFVEEVLVGGYEETVMYLADVYGTHTEEFK